ncbi:MAG: AraC family transcriptional regulator [Myxococcaceae bacterium]|nr:AraC family transcriptional regulator [Myxococcaceae bacterium]
MAPRASATYSVSGAGLAALLAWVKTRGVDLTPMLPALGLSLSTLSSSDTRVPVEAAEGLWAHAAERLGDGDFGLRFAARLDLDGFHVVGHLAASSATVGEALERVVAYSRLLHDAGRTELEAHGDEVHVFPGCRGLPSAPPRHIAEFNTASAVALIRFVAARADWKPQAVRFFHPAPGDVKPHRAFFGVTPDFKAPETLLVLTRADLALPVRVSAPSRLGQYLESYAQRLLADLPKRDEALRDQVLRALVAALPTGGLTIEQAAARFSMTPRTLQRRLSETSDSFSALVDEARLGTAERYLADDTLALGEISFLLGFQDPSTFHKAFRRWRGVPPGEWRARAQQAKVAPGDSRVS